MRKIFGATIAGIVLAVLFSVFDHPVKAEITNAQPIQCNQSISTSSISAQGVTLVTGVSGQTIYVCSAAINIICASTASTIDLASGTNACALVHVALWGPVQGPAATSAVLGMSVGGPLGYVFKTQVGDYLCFVHTGAAFADVTVSFSQF